jgi:hypothetical protein
MKPFLDVAGLAAGVGLPRRPIGATVGWLVARHG